MEVQQAEIPEREPPVSIDRGSGTILFAASAAVTKSAAKESCPSWSLPSLSAITG